MDSIVSSDSLKHIRHLKQVTTLSRSNELVCESATEPSETDEALLRLLTAESGDEELPDELSLTCTSVSTLLIEI